MRGSVHQIPKKVCLNITVTRGDNRRYIFNADEDFRYYYELLSDLREQNRVDVYHYCLMSRCIHLIACVHDASAAWKFLKEVNLEYFHYFRRQYNYCGHDWQDRYKGCVVRKDLFLLMCGKFIELNPVRSGLVESPDQYRYSSFSSYALGMPDILVTDNPIFTAIASTEKKRRKMYVDLSLPNDMTSLMGTG